MNERTQSECDSAFDDKLAEIVELARSNARMTCACDLHDAITTADWWRALLPCAKTGIIDLLETQMANRAVSEDGKHKEPF